MVSHAATHVVQLEDGNVATNGIVVELSASAVAVTFPLELNARIAAVVLIVLIGIATWVLLKTYKNHDDSVTAPVGEVKRK